MSLIQQLEDKDTIFKPHDYVGSVCGDNGLVYGIPHNATHVMEYNPSTKKSRSFGIDLGSSKQKWAGGVLALNGCIYASPFNANQILKIDPMNQLVTLVGDPIEVEGDRNKYISCVVHPTNKKIYCIPHDAKQILECDTTNDTTSYVGDTFDGEGGKWAGGCFSEIDKCFYFVPVNHKHVLKFDPSNNSTTTLIGEFPGSEKWISCATAPDGSIYCAPRSASHFLKINVRDGIATPVASAQVKQKQPKVGWNGCVAFTMNGDRYMLVVPAHADRIVIFSMKDESCHEIGPVIDQGKEWKYRDPVMSSVDNCMYSIPQGDDSILKIDVPQIASIYPSLIEGNVSAYGHMISKNPWLLQLTPELSFDNHENLEVFCKSLLETKEGHDFIHEWVNDTSKSHQLFQLVKTDRKIANIKNDKGQRAIDLALPKCKQAMESALLLFGKFDVADGPPLHCSLTACVLKATCLVKDGDENEELKTVDHVALKCMHDYEQVMAELNGRASLVKEAAVKPSVMKVRMIYVDSSIDEDLLTKLREAADVCNATVEILDNVDIELSTIIKEKRSNILHSQSEMDHQKSFKFLLEFDFAERTLATSLKHDQIFDSMFTVKAILQDIIENVAHLHKNGIIHGDLKPLNIVRVGLRWMLIDLDVSCTIGGQFGSKKPSSGYCPPEVARLIFAPDDGLKSYIADVAYDLWSIGVLIYYLCSGISLFHIDENDNIVRAGKQKLLEEWNDVQEKEILNDIRKDYSQEDRNLLKKLLEPDPLKRKEHFKNGVISILDEPFFNPEVILPNDQSNAAPKQPLSSIHVADGQFLVNCEVIDLPKSSTVTRSVAEAACDLVLYGARHGAGERKACSGMIVIVGSEEQFDKCGYVQGRNKFVGVDINVGNWQDDEEFVLSCFLQDLGLFIDCRTGKIMADHYKVDLSTRNADHNGGSKHVSASAAGMNGCLAIKCSEDCCLVDGKGKSQLKIFSGVKEPVSVDVIPNQNYSFTQVSRQQKRRLDSSETETNVKNAKSKIE